MNDEQFNKDETKAADEPRLTVGDVSAGGDAFVAGRDLLYFGVLSQLRPHPIGRDDVLRAELYVSPPFGDVPAPLVPPASDATSGPGVVVIVSDRPAGRRTSALRTLDKWLPSTAPIHELYPDWDEADADMLPCRPEVGYLLNLTGSQEALDDVFLQKLSAYAHRARDISSCLVVIADEYVAQGLLAGGGHYAAVPVVRLGRPNPVEVTRRRVLAAPDGDKRAAWLDDSGSVFADLLQGDEAPGEAVHLAEVIMRANGPLDDDARDEYLGWQHKLKTWFGGEDGDAEKRARQIAAACLDGAPARTILDAADALLGHEEINWPSKMGGPLAGADDIKRCTDADLYFAGDGTVSINHKYPGAGPALLQHVWRSRPQLVPLLSRWLGGISEPGGVAEGHLDKLAEALTTVAVSEGPEAVLGLVREWLGAHRTRRHNDIAVGVLSRLALSTASGARVRQELSGWAKGRTDPARQRAVMALCRGGLGREYPAIALKRLQYVLESNADEDVRREAVTSVGRLLADRAQGARTLKTIVDWATDEKSAARGTRLFLDVFDFESTTFDEGEPPDEAYGLLSRSGAMGETVRELFRSGWAAVWGRQELRARAAGVLSRWSAAAESELLPPSVVEDVISVIFTEEVNLFSDELDFIVSGYGAFRKRLLNRLVEAVMARQADHDVAYTPQPVWMGENRVPSA